MIFAVYDFPGCGTCVNAANNETFFCSSLTAEVYQELGVLATKIPNTEYIPSDFSYKWLNKCGISCSCCCCCCCSCCYMDINERDMLNNTKFGPEIHLIMDEIGHDLINQEREELFNNSANKYFESIFVIIVLAIIIVTFVTEYQYQYRSLFFGLFTGFLFLVIDAVLSQIFPFMFPHIRREYTALVFRDYGNWAFTYEKLHHFLVGYLFTLFFGILQQYISLHISNPYAVGVVYGMGICVLGTYPIFAYNFALLHVSRSLMFSWMLNNLIQYTLGGIFLAGVFFLVS